MKSFVAVALMQFVIFACGGDDDPPVDAGRDATEAPDAPTDAGTDAFVRLPAPTCRPPTPVDPPACGSGPVVRGALVPGPASTTHDAALAAQARRYDRGFHAIAALHTGVNTEVTIASEGDRETVRAFLQDSDDWDLEAFAGTPVEDMAAWSKVAGAYAGVGAAADAFRYAVLRDEGAACDEVERARAHVVGALHGMHRAVEITGAPGVIARGYIRRDLRFGDVFAAQVVPLFDAEGNPLPEEKTNGTWREDGSGAYPDYVWEDSCSRDMLVGWVVGMAALWEVIANDPSIDDALKSRLSEDATAIARTLMEVGESGHDLEIHDADGRLTFHAYLHESAIDRVYIPRFRDNGMHAIMALGIMAALGRIGGDEAVQDYVFNDLIRVRRLHEIARDSAGVIDFGTMTNYSNYNMAFDGAWLASRYVCDDEAAAAVRTGIDGSLYHSDAERNGASLEQSFFDFVFASAAMGSSVGVPLRAADGRETVARDQGLDTLRGFGAAPIWATGRVQCDEAEIAALLCELDDGSEVELLGAVGRGDELIAATTIPMAVRPPSNFHWRSNPFRVNATGDDATLYPAVDFRFVYWMGRYLTVE
jgi:hypothetical protein